MSEYGVSGPYFPAFGLNTKIYGVNLHFQSEWREIWTRKYSVSGHITHNVHYSRYSETDSAVTCSVLYKKQ